MGHKEGGTHPQALTYNEIFIQCVNVPSLGMNDNELAFMEARVF